MLGSDGVNQLCHLAASGVGPDPKGGEPPGAGEGLDRVGGGLGDGTVPSSVLWDMP